MPRPVRLFLALDVLMGMLYAVNHAIGAPFTKVNRLVDLDGEANLPTWFSSLQWAVVAALIGFVAVRSQRRGERGVVPCFLMAAAFGFLSMDEVAQVHEKLSIGIKQGFMNPGAGFRGMWLLIMGIPAALVLWRLGAGMRHKFAEAPGSMRLYLVGLVVFAIGAFTTEPLLAVAGGNDNATRALVLVEETLEMVGVTLLLWSAFKLAEREGLLAFEQAPAISRVTPAKGLEVTSP